MTLSCQPGDLIFFYGTGFLSTAIRLFTGGGPSHCAIVIDPSFVTDDGAGQGGPYIAESTIDHGLDGVQVNSLPLRISGYDKGGAIAIARLDSRIRALLDFDAMWKLLYDKVNRDRYEKLELIQYVTRQLPFFQYVPPCNNPKQEDCSELVAMLFAVGGLPGLDPFRTAPKNLFEMRMYSSLEWLTPASKGLGRFNTK